MLSPSGVQVSLLPELEAKGVVFTDLATAEKNHPEILAKSWGRCAPEDGKFAALAKRPGADRVFCCMCHLVCRLKQPLHSFCGDQAVNLAYFSHLMVWIDEGASVTYVHESASHTETEGQTLHAGMVEI